MANSPASTTKTNAELYVELGIDEAIIADLETCADTIEASRRTIIGENLRIGQQLVITQQLLANHGNGVWCKWVEARCKFSVSSAYNFVRAAKAVPEEDFATVANNFNANALYELVGPNSPATALTTALSAAREGKRITKKVAKQLIRQEAADARKSGVVVLPESVRIECRDLREWKLPPESVDLVLSDPMYDEPSLWQYGEIARLAAACLRPGGWALCYAGKMYIDKVLAVMSEHITFTWMFDVRHQTPTIIDSLQIEQGGKYIVGFRHKPEKPWWSPVSDRLEYRPEKYAGKLQQPVAEAAHLTRALCPAGGIVFDPMLGTGTAAVAAVGSDMQFVGSDIDFEMVQIATSRVAELLADVEAA